MALKSVSAKGEEFLTSAEMLHCTGRTPLTSEDIIFTDVFYTFKGRHFHDRHAGHLSSEEFETTKKAFLRLAAAGVLTRQSDVPAQPDTALAARIDRISLEWANGGSSDT